MEHKTQRLIAYYTDLLADDTSNIDARLRLASIWKDIDETGHAVAEYASAARLLASEGLFMEAIAACKAIFALDPYHTETQLFMASLYARKPQATKQERVVEVISPAPAVEGLIVLEEEDAIEELDDDDIMALSEVLEEDLRATNELNMLRRDPEAGEGLSYPEQVLRRALNLSITTGGASEVSSAGEEAIQDEFLPDDDDIEIALTDAEVLSIEPLEDDALFAVPTPVESAEFDTVCRPFSQIELKAVFRAGEDAENGEHGREEVLSSSVVGLEDKKERRSELTKVERPTPSNAAMQALEQENVNEDSAKDWGGLHRRDLPPTPLFSQLSPTTFVKLLHRLNLRRVPAGEIILSDEQPRRSLFLIVNGEVEVMRNNGAGDYTFLASLGRGEFFGEFQLLTGKSRRGVVKAVDSVDLLELNASVVATLAGESPELTRVLWEFYFERLLNNLLAGSGLFSGLEPEQRSKVAAAFVQENMKRGEICQEGEGPSELVLVLYGTLTAKDDEGEEFTRLEEGDFFGARVLKGGGREAWITTKEDVTLARLSLEKLEDLVSKDEVIGSAFSRLFEGGGDRLLQYGITKMKSR